jgi:DNA replication protein
MSERSTNGGFLSFKDLIDNTLSQAKNARPENIVDGDYQKDGLWYCGKCNTPKQCIVKGLGIMPCVCKCERERIEEEELKQLREERYNRNIEYIDTEYRNIYFKDSDNINNLSFAKNYVEHFRDYFKPNNIGLFIYGETGNGKTHIASMIANELVKDDVGVVMTTVSKAIEMYDNSYDFQDAIEYKPLVILDDFGISRTTEYQTERLYNLINARYQAKRPIIVTTNLTRQQLAQTEDLGLARIYDRIIEMTHPVLISSKGRRKAISKERFNEVENMLKGE